MKINKSSLFTITTVLAVAATACSPTPRRTLNNEEKAADLAWLYSQFGENYAPMEYKESRNAFKYEEMKASFLKRSDELKTNEEFYGLMHEFVSSFKDAHTSGTLLTSSLPGRAEVAYLGFSGQRVGPNFVVKKFLPTFTPYTSYPVKVGAVITAIDGVALTEAAKGELAKYRNLGQDESTTTANMSSIFNRLSTRFPLPTKAEAVLTLKTDTGTIDVTVPWVRKDYYEFLSEQRLAVLQKRAEQGKSNTGIDSANLADTNLFTLGFSIGSGEYSVVPSIFAKLDRKTKGFNFLKTFTFVDTAPIWDSKQLEKWLIEAQYGQKSLEARLAVEGQATSTLTPEEQYKELMWKEMAANRTLPTQYIRVMEAMDYPAYVTPVAVKNAKDEATGFQKYVGYIYLDTFSPNQDDTKVMVAFNATLLKFKELGVKDIVIDLINDGGGSLILGSKLAQALSPTKILLPDMQFRVSETWLDDFESMALYGDSDAEKELARKVLIALKEDKAQGRRLSRPINSEALMPWQISGNAALAGSKFNVVLLTNEFCASMCDIFSGIIKDNGMGTIVGGKTMGAGGNVVMHMSAPNTGFIVNQTESLIQRKDGSYLENNGVEPDVAFDVIADVATQFTATRNKAFEIIGKEFIQVTTVDPATVAAQPAAPVAPQQ